MYMGSAVDPDFEKEVLTSVDELARPLEIIYRSLVESGDEESDRHSEALDAITSCLGLGSYTSWSEQEKCDWLVKEIESKRPLLPEDMECSDIVKEVIATYKTISELPIEALGAYCISMSRATSDVLAVCLLQKVGGVKKFMRVSPLFETRDDLINAPKVIDAAFSVPWYKQHIQGKQEVMLGYSFRAAMQELADISAAEYQKTVFKSENDIFVRFFHNYTPTSELGQMNIGSRPAKRRAYGGIDTLRAIPWIFAWTQTRLMLPVWLGNGLALQKYIDDGKLPLLQKMYKDGLQPLWI
ncbi:PPC2 [Symbiodinium pilosum]|uniref:PPC2 protein n=1 Tax=Symbiodinium pilosum TaxID=2952 RepID=A0A812QLQ3_SYMPI|nr:PPC2 [Symbiodinium pilosum]